MMIDEQFFQTTSEDFSNLNQKTNFVMEYWPFSLWTLSKEFLTEVLDSKTLTPSIKEQIQTFIINPESQLKNDKGCCYILFVRDSKPQSILNVTSVLPLQWREGVSHDPCLPQSLKKIAQQIVTDMQEQGTINLESKWGLWLNFGTASCNLSKLDEKILSADSGWATLAASLVLSVNNGTPDHRIWASAAWNGNGIKNIDYIAQKLDAVQAFGGTIFFACEGKNYSQAQNHMLYLKKQSDLSVEIEIKTLPQGQNRYKEALSELLAHLNLCPPKNAPLTMRKEFYNRHYKFDQFSANKYYINMMQDDLAKECRTRMKIDLSKTKNLISFVSFTPSYRFVLYAIEPRNLLLFYTKETKKQKDEMVAILKNRYKKININEQLYRNENTEEENEEVRSKIREFVKVHSEYITALDLTPGPKDFTIQGIWALPNDNLQFLYLSHDYNPSTRSYQPGDEKIRLMQP